jgi:hypothetical protein
VKQSSSPGDEWLAVVGKRSTPEFASAFVMRPTLHASVLDAPREGVSEIASFFASTGPIPSDFRFTSQLAINEPTAGITILTRGVRDLIEDATVYYGPQRVAAALSAAIQRQH